MRQYLINDNDFTLILNALGELQGKYSFNAMRALTNLRPIETQKEDDKNSKPNLDETPKKVRKSKKVKK